MSQPSGDRPLAVDLCCGKGGWTIGLQAAGFRVVGMDLVHWSDYPGDYFIKQDIRTLTGSQFRGATLIVASPPCEEFSYRSFPFKRCREVGPPVLGIELFRACERIGKEAGVPYIIENVRGARKWVGPAAMHLGPFYLWGTGLPALWPPELRKVVKGFTRVSPSGQASNQTAGRRMGKTDPQDLWRNREGSCDGRRANYRENALGWASGGRKYDSHSNRRKEWSAMIAMIPFELARTVGEAHFPHA